MYRSRCVSSYICLDLCGEIYDNPHHNLSFLVMEHGLLSICQTAHRTDDRNKETYSVLKWHFCLCSGQNYLHSAGVLLLIVYIKESREILSITYFFCFPGDTSAQCRYGRCIRDTV